MIYYHGTTSAWVDSILKEGLKPDSQNAWKVVGTQFWNEGENLRKVEPVKWVYITPSLAKAKQFAEAKAEYLGLKPGEDSSWFYMKKAKGAPVIKGAKPVILKVEIPDPSQLSDDPRGNEEGQFLRYKGVIPASCITVLKGVQ